MNKIENKNDEDILDDKKMISSKINLDEISLSRTASETSINTVSFAGNKSSEYFRKHLQSKLNKLLLRGNILRLKYDSYKLCNDSVQIAIIITSTVMTLIEAIKAETKNEIVNLSNGAQNFLSLIPIFLSSSIAVSASILKFKKYPEKMEKMRRAIDQTISTTFAIKKIQEKSRHLKNGEFEELKKKYYEDTYIIYCKTNELVERCLKYRDVVFNMKKFHKLTLEYKKSEAHFELQNIKIMNEIKNGQISTEESSKETSKKHNTYKRSFKSIFKC